MKILGVVISMKIPGLVCGSVGQLRGGRAAAGSVSATRTSSGIVSAMEIIRVLGRA
jgi:hypothetical protein